MKLLTKNLLMFVACLLMGGSVYSQKLSKMTEHERKVQLELISVKLLKEYLLPLDSKGAYGDAENGFPEIQLGKGDNYLRADNIEKRVVTESYLDVYRDFYGQYVKDRVINVGDVIHIAKFTKNKKSNSIVYEINVFDDGKPVEINIAEGGSSIMVYKNDGE